MLFKAGKENIGRLLALVMVISTMLCVPAQAAKTVNVLDGQVSVTDSVGNGAVSNGTVTIQAKGGLLSQTTNNITITNESETIAQLTFTYAASNYSSFSEETASGTKTALLDPGGTVTMSIKGKRAISSNTATLTLSDFSLTVAADSSNVTVNYDSTLGSVTAGESAVAAGGVVEGVTLTDGVTLVATPASGAKFLGWVEADGKISSTAASYTLKPASDMTVKAVFAKDGGTPWFGVGATTQKSVSSGFLGMGKIYYHQVASFTHIFDDLNAAANHAAANSTKAVVLLNSATLPAGTYTIPAGVTLLIPFDSANSLYTTAALNTGTYTTPTAYRTLTMADGANLVINGAMSLSAKQKYAQGSKVDGGAPTGPVSFVKMQGNSNITVNNGGTLYAYGFITGSGTVTAKSGATIYEMFQIADFRGGSQTMDGKMDTYDVFPFSQYYVQNIEVPMTIYAGAKEYAYTTIYMSSADFGLPVEFIGSSGMFKLTSGYATKAYDGSTDRLNIELCGDATLSNIKVEAGGQSIDSKDYDLGLSSNITIKIKGSATIGQDIAILPGAEILVEMGGTCTLGSGNNIYIYDSDNWGKFCFAKENLTFKPVVYAPGRTYNRTEADLVDASILVNGTVDVSAGYAYTTAGGANIHSTGSGVVKTAKGTGTVTYQMIQAGDVANSTYVEIPLTPAKLKNGDGSFVQSATGTYIYTGAGNTGKWVCQHTTLGEDHVCSGCDATCVAYIQNGEVTTNYTDLQTALDQENKTVNLYDGYTVGSGEVIDLKGCDLVGTVDVTVGGMIIDSKTDRFDGSKAGSITGNFAGISSNLGKHYLAIYDATAGTTSFHRVAASFNAYRVDRVNGDYYMTVQGTFRGTTTGTAHLKSMGFVLVGDTSDQHKKYGGTFVDYSYTANNADGVPVTTTVQSTYVAYPDAPDSNEDDILLGAYDAPEDKFGQYVPINYTFETTETGVHRILCRVDMTGDEFYSAEHTATVVVSEVKPVAKEAQPDE